LQVLSGNRPLPGIQYLAYSISHYLPPYQGVVRLRDDVLVHVDAEQGAERTILFTGDYHPPLTRLLRQHTPQGGYCLDIGANVGYYTLQFATWAGRTGKVAAFEANPHMVERLEQNVSLNQFSHVEIVNKAVHRESGTMTFYVSSSPGKSSVIAGHVAQPIETLTVAATTVDEYVQTAQWQRLDAIKMDIEGNDCNALLGAAESLSRFRPFIAFEYWYNTPPEVSQPALDLLHELGYTLTGVAMNGRHVVFDPHKSDGNKHIDVVGEAARAP
jgi:FkbM family methyltransferase